MVIFNVLGGAMCLVGYVAGALTAGEGSDVNWVVAGLVVLALDLGWRFGRRPPPDTEAPARLGRRFQKQPSQATALFHPSRGGNVFWLPLWLVALTLFLVGFVS